MATVDYQVSKHFYDRLNQRFNVPVSEAQKWIKRFFANAVKDHCEENGRKALFKKDLDLKLKCNTCSTRPVLYSD